MIRHRLLDLGLLLFILAVLAMALRAGVDRVQTQPWGNPVGEVYLGIDRSQVGQSFRAPLPGLQAIELQFEETGATGQRVDSTRLLVFHLKSSLSSASDLWSSTLSAADLADGKPYRFEFAPIQSSEGKSFYLYVEAASPEPQPGIRVHYGPDSTLEDASAYVDGQPVPGDLQFRTFYRLRTRDKIDVLLTRLTAGRPYVLGSKAFYIGLALAYLIALASFIWLVVRAALEEDRS